jgi:hypothetical protein
LLEIGLSVTMIVAVPVLSFTLNFLKNTDIIIIFRFSNVLTQGVSL